MSSRIAIAVALCVTASLTSLFPSPVAAQEPRTGIVQVTVQESMGMVSGLLIRSAGRSARTDSAGRARRTLPVGRQAISVTGIGYKPAQVALIVVADSVVNVTVPMEMGEMTMEAVRITATRIEKLAG